MSSTASPAPDAAPALKTACVVMIGDELLSGRTKDANLAYIAQHLNEVGVQVREARVIPDVEEIIVSVINEVRASFDYVFTTGGIGPTHDDITADSVAKAFGVPIGIHPEAFAILDAHYKETGNEFTEARKRMARIPETAELLPNRVSRAPGFRIGNVYVMAGIPMVMQVMLDEAMQGLEGGAKMMSRTVSAAIGEGTIAEKLGSLQERFPTVSLGSYPFYRGKVFGVSLVARSTDVTALDAVAEELAGMIRSFGIEPELGDGT